MDPNANLEEQRRIVKRNLDGKPEPGDANRLAELVDVLDTWLSGGGFLPRVWTYNH